MDTPTKNTRKKGDNSKEVVSLSPFQGYSGTIWANPNGYYILSDKAPSTQQCFQLPDINRLSGLPGPVLPGNKTIREADGGCDVAAKGTWAKWPVLWNWWKMLVKLSVFEEVATLKVRKLFCE